jgi:D-alanyl-lipoteichoic acid acyltransferase DltB (MBOAT superfamily)
MLFNSFIFLLFFSSVFVLHWFVFSKTVKLQNIFLLVASLIFYGFWDWRFLILLLFSIAVIFYSGLNIYLSDSDKKRKIWLRFGLFSSLGFLFFFKYFNFFLVSFIDSLKLLGIAINLTSLNIVLPIAISFYTFHGVSYLLDIYYRRIKPSNYILNYALFVSYFPLLVAGPIERATHLLPQLSIKRKLKINDINCGLSLVFWGFFKKIAVADALGMIVDMSFSNPNNYSSLSLILGAIFFAFQIYADFSGYTDIARGVSRFFGIELLLNFNFPYFSKSIPEFWSRWHMSLSSFLNDYVFIPLALYFRDYNKWGIYFSIFLTFLISGFWHGAGWNFVFWGILHGLYYLPQFLNSKSKIKSITSVKKSETNSFVSLLNQLKVFGLIVFALIFFRSDTIDNSFRYLNLIVENSQLFSIKEFVISTTHLLVFLKGLISLFIMMLLEYYMFKNNIKIDLFFNSRFKISILLLMLGFLGSFENSIKFIYFQF